MLHIPYDLLVKTSGGILAQKTLDLVKLSGNLRHIFLK